MSAVTMPKPGRESVPVRLSLEFANVAKVRHDLELLRTASQWGLHCLALADTQGQPAALSATRQLMKITAGLIKG